MLALASRFFVVDPSNPSPLYPSRTPPHVKQSTNNTTTRNYMNLTDTFPTGGGAGGGGGATGRQKTPPTPLKVQVGSPTTLATEVKVPSSSSASSTTTLLAFCPSLRAVAYSTGAGGGGVEMALISPSTDEIIPASRVSVPLGAAGAAAVDAEQVMALQWCASGMAHGTAVLVAMDPSGAACGVVRLSDDGARLILQGVKAISVERPTAGGPLRQLQASPSHPAVALLSPASVRGRVRQPVIFTRCTHPPPPQLFSAINPPGLVCSVSFVSPPSTPPPPPPPTSGPYRPMHKVS